MGYISPTFRGMKFEYDKAHQMNLMSTTETINNKSINLAPMAGFDTTNTRNYYILRMKVGRYGGFTGKNEANYGLEATWNFSLCISSYCT